MRVDTSYSGECRIMQLLFQRLTARMRPANSGQVHLCVALILILAAPHPAAAQLSVCNQSLDVLNVAIGHDRGTGAGGAEAQFFSEGWWTVGPNQCANVIRTPLVSRFIYVHAEDALGQVVVTGDVEMCVEPARFNIEGIGDCWTRGLIGAGFQQVDTVNASRWTVFIPGTK